MKPTNRKCVSIASWYAPAKVRLAPTIADELGPHVAYWEPFCGGISVIFAKPQCGVENHQRHAHIEMINLAKCIQHPTHGPGACSSDSRRALCMEARYLENHMREYACPPRVPHRLERIDIDRAYALLR